MAENQSHIHKMFILRTKNYILALDINGLNNLYLSLSIKVNELSIDLTLLQHNLWNNDKWLDDNF